MADYGTFLKLCLACCLIVAVNDTLDDILTESGDEEEQDAVVNQILDEIGIEITDKVCACSYLVDFITYECL